MRFGLFVTVQHYHDYLRLRDDSLKQAPKDLLCAMMGVVAREGRQVIHVGEGSRHDAHDQMPRLAGRS